MDSEKSRVSKENEEFDYLEKSGSVVAEKNGNKIHCISIVGQIEGHYILPQNNKTTKYEHVIPLLVAVEESENKEYSIPDAVKMAKEFMDNGMSPTVAAKNAAAATGLRRNEIYKELI